MEFYLQEWNGTKAARLAGYKGNDNVLAVTAHRLLRKPNVREAIEERLSTLVMTTDEVLWRLGEQARADLSHFFSINKATGEAFIDLNKAKEAGKTHLIKRLKYDAKGNLEIQLYDQQAALVHIGRHLGMFEETAPSVNINFNLEEWAQTRANRKEQVEEMPDPPEAGDEVTNT